jgi:tellurite methyltransferase
MTRKHSQTPWNPWPEEYRKTPDIYIWGTEPSSLARELAELLPTGARILDLGCGEGRDSVFFAEQGFDVTGLDSSLAGLDKAGRLADQRGVSVRWVHGAMPQIAAGGPFDLVYSCGSIHYVPCRQRPLFFRRVRVLTAPAGLHAHVVFTDTLIYREMGEVIDYFRPGELADVYADWAIIRQEEGLIACGRDGMRHVHSVDVVLARNGQRRDARSASSREEAQPCVDMGSRRPQHSLP